MAEVEERLAAIENKVNKIAEQLDSLYSLFVALNEKLIDNL